MCHPPWAPHFPERPRLREKGLPSDTEQVRYQTGISAQPLQLLGHFLVPSLVQSMSVYSQGFSTLALLTFAAG